MRWVLDDVGGDSGEALPFERIIIGFIRGISLGGIGLGECCDGIAVLVTQLGQGEAGLGDLGVGIALGGGEGFVQLGTQFLKRSLYLLRLTASLINFANTLFNIDTRLNGAQHFVTGTEYAFEKFEFLIQQFKN